MTVYWDTYGGFAHGGGITTYGLSLYPELVKLGLFPILLTRDACTEATEEVFKTIKRFYIPKPSKLLGSKWAWPHYCRYKLSPVLEKNPFVFHGLNNINLPFCYPKRTNEYRVITIHDLIPLIESEGVSASYYMQYKAAIGWVVKNADQIVTVSHWTKKQLLTRFNVDEKKIKVIHNGFVFKEPTQTTLWPKNKRASLLYVSRFEKYKNFSFLPKLLDRLPSDYCFNLVTDEKGRMFANKYCSRHLNKKMLLVKTNVSNTELNHLYDTANVYVHLSKYEGFGLPLSEAISWGTPVMFVKGSGMDEYIPQSIGYSMAWEAEAQDWVDVIFSLIEKKQNPQYQKEILNYSREAQSWRQAAFELKKVYNYFI